MTCRFMGTLVRNDEPTWRIAQLNQPCPASESLNYTDIPCRVFIISA